VALLDFKGDSGKRPARKLRLLIIATAISGSLTLGYTLAANISLNNGQVSEFGQGVVMTTACTGSDSLIVTPQSNYDNGETTFKLSDITVSHIPQSCKGAQFKISIYSDSQALDLDTGVQIARVIYRGEATRSILKGASGVGTFGAEIINARVTDTYGQFTIHLTGDPSTSLELQKMTIESSCGADGTDESRAADNAYEIHMCNPGSPSGLYWIQNDNLNGGDPFQIYADMERNGGGWTLILANSNTNGWQNTNTLDFNADTPPSNPLSLSSIDGHYSIVSRADYLKRAQSGFQYRIEANNPGEWGGIWTANQNYSFISQSNGNTDITLNTKFGPWNYSDIGIEPRMPYFAPNDCAQLTTSESAGGQWWGTLVSRCGYDPAPWIADGNPGPGIIWYWVR
jgi:hypothetical protein